MNNKSLFIAFAGCELTLECKALLIKESLESNIEPIISNKVTDQTLVVKKKSSLTSPGFPFQNQNSEIISE